MATISLAPGALDISGVRAGDRNELAFVITQNGTPMDLTGMDVMAQARKAASDADPPALTGVVTITDAPAGRLTLRWDGDEVRALLGVDVKWQGVWDLQVGATGSEPDTIVAGSLTCELDVTR